MSDSPNRKNEKFESYLFEYTHDGRTCGFEIMASSAEDARARLLRLPYATYCGVVEMRIPVELGIFVKLICWFRNRIAAIRYQV